MIGHLRIKFQHKAGIEQLDRKDDSETFSLFCFCFCFFFFFFVFSFFFFAPKVALSDEKIMLAFCSDAQF